MNTTGSTAVALFVALVGWMLFLLWLIRFVRSDRAVRMLNREKMGWERDPVTGAYAHLAWMRHAEGLYRVGARWVIVIGIDQFPQLVGKHGQSVGKELLREVADRFEAGMAEDEAIVGSIADGTMAAISWRAPDVERLKAGFTFPVRWSGGFYVTTSLGIERGDGIWPFGHFFKMADNAMLRDRQESVAQSGPLPSVAHWSGPPDRSKQDV